MGEFDLKSGSARNGALAMIGSAMLFMLLPFLLFTVLSRTLGSSEGGASGDGIQQVANLAIILGLFVAIASFFRGYYPKGTVSRLTFGLALSLAIFVYIWMVFVQSGLEAALDQVSFHADVWLASEMLLLVAATVPLRCLGEFVDQRKAWKKRNGVPFAERPVNPESGAMEVHPRTGSSERAALGARSLLLRSMAVPVIVIIIAVAVLVRYGDAVPSSLIEILAEESLAIMTWAIPLVVLGFARGFYPLGSLGRMSSGLMMSVFIALYLHALLLGGAIESWLAGQGVPLDLDLVWLFLMVLVAFHAAMQVSELVDNRRGWKVAIGRKVPEAAEEERHSLLLDFRPRYGRYVSGTKEARRAAKRYLVSPAITVLVIMALLHKLSSSMDLGELSPILDSLGLVYDALLLFALPLIVLTFFRGFYPKGSFSRLTFGWLVAITLALWIWVLTSGGRLATDVGMDRMDIGVQLDVSGLIFVFMAIELLWGAYYLAEYLSYRKDWIANGYRPVDDRAARMRDIAGAPVADQAGQ